MVWAYLFEAKGIQRYLFTTGRLRDVVGGSDLVARIALSGAPDHKADLIGQILSELGLEVVNAVSDNSPDNQVSFSRRAGAAFCLHGHMGDLVRIRRKVRERVMSALPGLEISDGLGKGADEIASRDAAFEASGGLRSNMAAQILPLGNPLMDVAPQTGLPVTKFEPYGPDDDRELVALDLVSQSQRERADKLQKLMQQGKWINDNRQWLDGVALRFHPEGALDEDKRYAYPRNLEPREGNSADNPAFPFVARGRGAQADYRLAMVHADLSGLGQAFQNANIDSAKANLALAKQIENAILRAVRGANQDLLIAQAAAHREDDKGAATEEEGKSLFIVPARPIVLGGDDITVLVRADLAMAFAADLLDRIEKETMKIKEIEGGLSACAGVAIAHKGLPFLTMNALAESLCGFAKKKAKEKGEIAKQPWPSMLAFHVQTQSAEEDYAHDIYPLLEAEGYGMMSANPFRIGKANANRTGCGDFRKLGALAKAIADLSGAAGSLRGIRGEIANGDLVRADAIWARLCGVRLDRSEAQNNALKAFRLALDDYVKSDDVSESLETDYGVPVCGALFDALELIDIGALAHMPEQPDAAPEQRTLEGAAA